MELISNFFNGNIKLWKSFWFVGFGYPYLLGIVYAIVVYLLGLQLKDALYIIPSVFLACHILATIGVWRSANKYKGKKIFGILAKLFMLIGFIYIITDFNEPWYWLS